MGRLSPASLGRFRARGGSGRELRLGPAAVVLLTATAAPLLGCGYDQADRWDRQGASPLAVCAAGAVRCSSNLERCAPTAEGGTAWAVVDDCTARGQICAPTLLACAACIPEQRVCDGFDVMECAGDGAGRAQVATCAGGVGISCRSGGCVNLCDEARKVRSNVGCEYWAADLDNANVGATKNAAAQQYAVVVSNPQPDLPASITIEVDDAPRGAGARVRVVAEATIAPSNLRVFKLGPREVDGSPEGEFDTGAGTAWTRQAYRIRSTVPVVAYQFNPLDNVNVFSNDASLLKPVEAVTDSPGTLDAAYLVLGWPQTIASTQDPETNFNPADPTDLRSFVTILGTRPDTRIRVTTAARVIAGVDVAEVAAGGQLEMTLQPFEVLNLETGGFNADFTGSLIEADQPVIVFAGGEASDAPTFDRLADRFCCADHLEEQLDPIRTAGKSFFAAHAPNRSRAVKAAGVSLLDVVQEPEYFRVLAVGAEGPIEVTTTLPAPDDRFTLPGRGAYRDLTSYRDFHLLSDQSVMLASVQASQDASGVQRGLPGGDPSLIIIPPTEQYRTDYVFLTPDKYAFDFVVIVAEPASSVLLDGRDVRQLGCEQAPADGLTEEERGSAVPPAVVYRCQLSYPIVLPDVAAPQNVLPGNQNDGVHRVQSERTALVLVYGFDNYVSYGYAGGTQLETLNLK